MPVYPRTPRPQLPEPALFGLPPHFVGWRDYQEQAIHDIAAALGAERGEHGRFCMGVIPTGAGKSLIYITLAALLGARTAILTRTKALQDQLERDFSLMGLLSVRGANSYPCVALQPGGELYGTIESVMRGRSTDRAPSCEDGPCRQGVKCSGREGGCGYYDAVARAKDPHTQLLVTNYTYWMYQHQYGGGLGKWDLLVLDEAHEAPDALSDFLSVTLEKWMPAKVGGELPEGTPEPEQWASWGAHYAQRVATALEALQLEIKARQAAGSTVPRALLDESKALRHVAGVFDTVSKVDASWVHYWKPEARAWLFAPSWPAPFAEGALFQGVPRILLTSATVRPKTAWYLGIPEPQLTVFEYDSTFPKARRPVYYLPTVRVDQRMTEGMRKLWVRQIDRIMEQRADRKGIIHTVSYQRARDIQALSEHGDRMILHTSEGTRSAIERFRASSQDEGMVLVSPSLSTGYDFKYTDCEYQIISKVPFPHTADPLMKARTALDPDYALYHTLQTLVQMVGRGMRAPDDQCETFIIDDHMTWVLWRNKHLVPRWFLDSVSTVQGGVPRAPARLVMAE